MENDGGPGMLGLSVPVEWGPATFCCLFPHSARTTFKVHLFLLARNQSDTTEVNLAMNDAGYSFFFITILVLRIWVPVLAPSPASHII